MDIDPPQSPRDPSAPPQPPPSQPSGPGGVAPHDHEQLRARPIYFDRYGGRAGAVVEDTDSTATSQYHAYSAKLGHDGKNPYAPFSSCIDWEIARWAKMRRPTSTAFSELLSIDGVIKALGLSFANSSQLNTVIDNKLPLRRPAFKHFDAVAMGETFDMYARDPLECIAALYGDPEHIRYLVIVPERHYADADKTIQLYHDLHTGQWWWVTQKQIEAETPGATIIPVILSSDKTQITLFRNKSAYPVYLTIGNLPKSIRRKPSCQGQILLAYLPTSRLDHITNKAQRRRVLANLFHACMTQLVKPLKSAGLNGIILTSGDGVQRRCHPVLAVYVGDYPEQCLVTGAFTGDCPTCMCKHDDLEDFPCEDPYRDHLKALKVLELLGTPEYAAKCRELNMKPLQHPFWQGLPYVDIFRSITPDILHQLYQGVFKHLVGWLTAACGAVEIDARVHRLPPNHSIRIFHKGITTLSRVSGAEHKQISAFILGLIVNSELPDQDLLAPLLRATRALLDFLYIAQYSSHNDQTLAALNESLAAFHADRDVFVQLGIRTGFNIPKLHFLQHYVRFIKLYGTIDNYNTEATKRLHIDFAKDAYRVTNHKDEYPQMTKWLERREKILYHANYITWRLQQVDIGPATLSAHHDARWESPDMACDLHVKMTHHPTRRAVSLDDIISSDCYGATFFIPAFARFVAQFNNPHLTAARREEIAQDIHLPTNTLPVFHRIKFWNDAVHGNRTLDSIHIHPSTVNDDDTAIPARFDTALIRVRSVAPDAGGARRDPLEGMRVGRVHVVFSLPPKAAERLFSRQNPPPRHLAYVEWFSPFLASPEPNTGLYKIKCPTREQDRLTSIIPVALIQRSVHLTPKWGGPVPMHWTSENVLDQCTTFLLNPFKDAHTYYHLY